mgnify:CR=1 FL=1
MRAWLDECRRVAVSVSSRLGNTEILLLMLLSLWAPTMQLKTEGLFFFWLFHYQSYFFSAAFL